MTSLHARLRRSLMRSIVPLIVVVGLGFYLFIRATLLARFDDGLLARARALSALVSVSGSEVDLDFSDRAMPQYEPSKLLKVNQTDELRATTEYFEVWKVTDSLVPIHVDSSESLGKHDLELPMYRDEQTWDVTLPDGSAGRQLSLRYTPEPDEDDPPVDASKTAPINLLIVVAMSRHDLDRTLALLAGSLVVSGSVVLVGVFIAVRRSLRAGLAPIGSLTAQLDAIGTPASGTTVSLESRLSDALPTELAPIALRTNLMLDRIAASFEREKQLAASAAHELRTPIAEIRTVSELALSQPRDADTYRQSLETILTSARHMSESADAVLRLARVQSGRERPVIEPIPLGPAIRAAFDPWTTRLAERGIQLQIDPSIYDARVVADASMLRVILDNLAANAAEHATSSGPISITSTISETHTTVTITNWAGTKIPPTTTSETMPPQDHSTHTGLGLSIAAAMAHACQGQLFTRHDSGIFAAELLLPAVHTS